MIEHKAGKWLDDYVQFCVRCKGILAARPMGHKPFREGARIVQHQGALTDTRLYSGPSEGKFSEAVPCGGAR